MFSRIELRLCTLKYQRSSFTKPEEITTYFLQYYGYLLLYIDYPLMMPFYHTVVAMTHQNVINLLAVQLQMAAVTSYRDKPVSVQDILTHEAKHNKHTHVEI